MEKLKKKRTKIRLIVELMLSIIIVYGILFLFKDKIRGVLNGDDQPNYWPADRPEPPWPKGNN